MKYLMKCFVRRITPCLLFLLLLLLLLPPAAFAEQHEQRPFIETYTSTVELQEKTALHTQTVVIRNLSSSLSSSNPEIQLKLPPRVEELSMQIDGRREDCRLEEKKGFSLLSCRPPAAASRHFLELAFESTYPLLEIQNRILYKSEYIPLYPTGTFFYILKLPPGYVIPPEKEISFFVNPQPESIYSDGRRIILRWERKDLSERWEVSALIEPLPGRENIIIITVMAVSGMALLGAGALWFWHLVHKRRNKGLPLETTPKEIPPEYAALLEKEQGIVQLLSESREKWLWQKQLRFQSGLSKVQLSRLLRRLEERGVIRKEPVGNTNKIHLQHTPPAKEPATAPAAEQKQRGEQEGD